MSEFPPTTQRNSGSNAEGARGDERNATIQQSTHQATQQYTHLKGVCGGIRGSRGKRGDVDDDDGDDRGGDDDDDNDAEETNAAQFFVSFSSEKETKEHWYPSLLF